MAKFILNVNKGSRDKSDFEKHGEYLTLSDALSALADWTHAKKVQIVSESNTDWLRWAYDDGIHCGGFLAALIDVSLPPYEEIDENYFTYPPFGCVIS